MRKLISLFAVAVLAQAQTPTQIDYNGNQIKNKPTTYTAVPGANTLGPAIAKTPSGGTLIVPSGSFTLSSNVIITTPNITIECQPGALISPSVNNIHVLLIEAANVTIKGCVHTGNGTATGGQFIATTSDASNLTITGNTFKNGGSGWQAIRANLDGAAVTGLTLRGNTYSNISNGVGVTNTDQISVQDETCTNVGPTGDCFESVVTNGTFASGASIYVRHVVSTGTSRIGVEIGGLGYANAEVVDCEISTTGDQGISVAVAATGFSDQSKSIIVHRNQIIYPSTASSDVGAWGIEAYGSGLLVADNSVIGSFQSGILFGGPKAQIVRNVISGSSSTTAQAIVPNYTNGPSDHVLIADNTIINARTGSVGGNFPGGIIRNNHSLRNPGYYSADSSTNYLDYFVAASGSATIGGATEPLLLDGNVTTILAPLNGYTMPGTMGFVAYNLLADSGDAPIKVVNGSVSNVNATAFGTALSNSSFARWVGDTISGMTFTNLAAIFTSANPCGNTTVFFSENSSLIGAGSGQPPTACVISQTYKNVVYSETGADNAIAGSVPTMPTSGGVPTPGNGTACVTVILAHALQAGANTFALNGGTVTAIKSHFNPSSNIATAYTSSGIVSLCLSTNGGAWLDQSQ